MSNRPAFRKGDPVFIVSMRCMARGDQPFGYVQAVALRSWYPTLRLPHASEWVVCVAMHSHLAGCHAWFPPDDLCTPCLMGCPSCSCHRCRAER